MSDLEILRTVRAKMVAARKADGAVVAFTIAIKTTNPLNANLGNSRLSGVIRARARASQRHASHLSTIAAMRRAGVHPTELVPCVVTLTRVSSGTMDTDGLAASQKGVRDGIADALGLDDGGPFCEWRYQQQRGKRGVYGVEVRIERKG